MNSTEPLSQHNATKLALWLHDYPRKDRGFADVTNEFDPENMTYLEGVALAAAPLYLLALLTLLFFFLRACIRGCNFMCHMPKLQERDRPSRVLCIFFVVSLLVIGGLGYGYVANETVSEGVMKMAAAIEDMDDHREENLVAALDVQESLGDLQALSVTLLDQLNALDATGDLVTVPAEATSQLSSMSTNMTDAQQFIGDGVSSFEDADMAEYIEQIEYYDGLRYLAQLVLLGALASPFLLVFLGLVCKFGFILWHVTWVAVLCAVLGWTISGVELSVSLFVADFCIDPNEYILEKAAENENVLPYARYYLICDGIVNPLQSELDRAQNELLSSIDYLSEVNSYISDLEAAAVLINSLTPTQMTILFPGMTQGPIPNNTFSDINATIGEMRQETDAIQAAVNVIINTLSGCRRVHRNYVDTLDGLCTLTLSGVVGLLSVQTFISLLLWVAIFCAVKLYRYFRFLKGRKRQQRRNSLREELEKKNANTNPNGPQQQAPIRQGRRPSNAPPPVASYNQPAPAPPPYNPHSEPPPTAYAVQQPFPPPPPLNQDRYFYPASQPPTNPAYQRQDPGFDANNGYGDRRGSADRGRGDRRGSADYHDRRGSADYHDRRGSADYHDRRGSADYQSRQPRDGGWRDQDVRRSSDARGRRRSDGGNRREERRGSDAQTMDEMV